MRRALAAVSITALLLAASSAPAAERGSAQSADGAEATRTGDVIVRFKPGATLAAVGSTLADAETTATKTSATPDIARVSPLPGQSVDDAIAALEADPDVLYAEPNYVLSIDTAPNDPNYGTQWHYPKIGLPMAWDQTTGSASVIVAVIDTGVELTDTELDSKITSGANAGYDFANGDADASDDHGHGTHVAGTIAAETNNASGVAGVCWACKIMPVKVLDSTGSGSTDDVAAGIDWARTHGAKVVNLSLGSPGNSITLHNAVNNAFNAGVVVVAAAGNNAGDGDTSDDAVLFPAAYTNAIGVGATDSTDTIASFSNYGPELDVTAPGVSILSTVLGAGYQSWSGTSMATPHVAGVVGLMMSAGITDPATIRTRLINTATDLGAVGFDNYYGHGRVNAHHAIDTSLAAPTVTAPAAAAIVSGSAVTFSASATDANGIASVRFIVDGSTLTTDTSAPYSTAWNTTVYNDGSHTLTVEATDNADNTAMSAGVAVTVQNGETTAPTVSITAPSASATVAGSVAINANASDGTGISKVRFWVGATYLGYDTTAPYSKTWDTVAGLNGKFTLKAEAVDVYNNAANTTISVTVVNPDAVAPTVTMTSPANGAGVAGSAVTINATASDALGLQKVQFWVGSTYLGYDATAPYSRTWDTTMFVDGPHIIKARAVDWANNYTDATISVTVGNSDGTSPTASLDSPADGATVAGIATINASASDNVAIQKVRFWVDATYLGYDSTAAYSKTWDSTSVANGAHTIRVQSVDLANNVSSDATITVNVSN